VGYKFFVPSLAVFEIMSVFSLLGLVANSLCWQKPIFAQLVISLNLILAELRLGLKNYQVGEKWVSDDCAYLCKGLIINQPTFSKIPLISWSFFLKKC
jgi:hypothetical protein